MRDYGLPMEAAKELQGSSVERLAVKLMTCMDDSALAEAKSFVRAPAQGIIATRTQRPNIFQLTTLLTLLRCSQSWLVAWLHSKQNVRNRSWRASCSSCPSTRAKKAGQF